MLPAPAWTVASLPIISTFFSFVSCERSDTDPLGPGTTNPLSAGVAISVPSMRVSTRVGLAAESSTMLYMLAPEVK